MSTVQDYTTPVFPSWCPGCGDFGIWGSLKQTLAQLGWGPHQFLSVFGIGCSGNMTSFVKCYGIHSLHGRAIPSAIGAKLANHTFPVLVVGGDGDLLGEGLSHFIHAARANHDMTVILHNNQIYGLTTGQASPTSMPGLDTKTTPHGVIELPLDPSALAILSGAGFVARGFSGDMPHLTSLMIEAIKHPGFSLVEVLQPCVTFNHLNTYEWFRKRIKKVEMEGSDPLRRNFSEASPSQGSDLYAALKLAEWTEETINTGILYRNTRPAYHALLPQLKEKTLVESTEEKRNVSKILEDFH